MERSHRRALRLLVVPLVAALAVLGLSPPASAQQNTIRGAAGNMLVGAAVTPSLLNNSTYADIVRTHFSSLTAENQMKMDALQPSQGNFNFGPADQIVQFAQQNNQVVYGHTLVWHSQSPGWVQNLSGSAMQSAMQNHITTVMQRYGNQVPRWDVANEVIDDNAQLRNSFWLQGMGQSYINQAFQFAQQAQPNSVRCLNDYSIDGINAKSNAYFDMVQQMLQQGVPINCMGFQAHLILGQVPGNMQQNLQRFANLGLEVWITELDIRMNLPASQQNLQQQASEYAQVYQICRNVSGCRGVTTWGVHEGQSWVPGTFPGQGEALMWDSNFNPKPAVNAVIQALGGGGPGPQPPAAPTGLSSSNVTDNSVTLSWNGSSGATQYQILRAPGASGGSFQQVGTASGTSFTNTGLSAGTTYRYQVTASNANGTSSPSSTVTVTTSGGGGGPGPGGCSATGTVQTQWGNGYVVQPVTVTNTGSASITGWSVTFTLPAGHSVVGSWNAQFSGTSGSVTATNMSYNGSLSGGGSTSFGFQVSRPDGNTQTPTSYSCTA